MIKMDLPATVIGSKLEKIGSCSFSKMDIAMDLAPAEAGTPGTGIGHHRHIVDRFQSLFQ